MNHALSFVQTCLQSCYNCIIAEYQGPGCLCVLQEMMQIFAASSSRNPWMRYVLCQRPRFSTRAPSRPCGWRSLRGPQSSSGDCFTNPLPILSIAPVFFSFRQVPTSLLLFSGTAMCTEVPPPRATFRSRTSTWLWQFCWSWLCNGGLLGWLHICTSDHTEHTERVSFLLRRTTRAEVDAGC